MKNTLIGAEVIAQRQVNAHLGFIEICTERGFTTEEAERILAVYIKAKAVKLDSAMGRYKFAHGAFVDVEVMRNALKQGS